MKQPTRREVLQTLVASSALAACGEAGPGLADATTASDAGPDVAQTCLPVGAGSQVSHGPISGAVTDQSLTISLRCTGPAKVQLELQPLGGGAVLRSGCTHAAEADDFAVRLQVNGLPAGQRYLVTPLLDDVPQPAHAIQTHTFPSVGKVTAFSFCFGSCQRHGGGNKGNSLGKTYDVVAALAERPQFFAQIGDWTYPDYLFSAQGGLDQDGNNYTVFPEKLRESWHRRMDPSYPMRKVLQQVPLAHVWDDHDFAENNGHRDVTGSQAARVDAFARYLPTWPLAKSKGGVWQRFAVGHVDFWLADMRSQRTDQSKAVVKETDGEGKVTKLRFVEPPDHTLLGEEQLKWLLDGLRASKAMWKVVFFPVEVNPRYDLILNLGIKLKYGLVVEAAADGWAGYPSERKQLLDLHKSGEVKNLLFLTGDAHQASMKERDAECPPVFMAANLDIGQAPVVDLMEDFGIPRGDVWPYWTQDASGLNTVGRVQFVTEPKHEVWCDALDQNGVLLKRMVVPLQT